MEDDRPLFDQIQCKDHVSWNARMTGYAQNGGGEEALKLHSQKLEIGLHPDKWTLVSVLTACSSLASLKNGRQTLLLIIKHGFESNLSLYNALITMYSKCDLVARSWNTIIAAFAQNGLYEKALGFFNRITVCGLEPDGKVNESLKFFDSMVCRYGIAPRSEHYACLVGILCCAGQLEKACNTIQEIPLEADSRIRGSLVVACSVHVNVEIGELAAKYILDLNPRGSGPYVLLSNIFRCCIKFILRASFLKPHGLRKLWLPTVRS
ncbi:unnamed protein product [Malus baccata var. baccata]